LDLQNQSQKSSNQKIKRCCS